MSIAFTVCARSPKMLFSTVQLSKLDMGSFPVHPEIFGAFNSSCEVIIIVSGVLHQIPSNIFHNITGRVTYKAKFTDILYTCPSNNEIRDVY